MITNCTCDIIKKDAICWWQLRQNIIEIDKETLISNVKEFKDMANTYIKDILNRGKVPILVGGSGFYIRAILYNTDFL